MLKGMTLFGTALAVLVFAAGAASADAIDFNFTGGTLDGVSPLASDLDDDWGTGLPLPSGAEDADDRGDYIENSDLDGVSFTKDGLTLTATANLAGGSTRLYGDTRGIQGGLGAYAGDGKVDILDEGTNIGGAGSNDNIQEGESVKIDFGTEKVWLSDGWFFDNNHTNLSEGDEFKVVVDGSSTVYFTVGADGSLPLFLNLTGSTFEFFNIIGETGRNGADFYVSMLSATVVPEPSTIVLMGAAGLGVIFMGRRRRKLASAGEATV